MTRLETEATIRVAQGDGVELVLELRADTVTIRPKHSREGGDSEISVRWQTIYERALMNRAIPQKPKRKVSRGLLGAER